jgi:hypothetical protein
MKLDRKKVLSAAVVVVVTIGLLEVVLGLLALVSPRIDRLLASPQAPQAIAPAVPDARLGHRPNPAYPGHDSKGFRNPEVPGEAWIVALGDSQTYGTGVRAEESWPRQLESIIGESVYSMAYGGYGPAHSLVLWDEAVALSPKVVIEAFYAGNDLFDSFDLVYNQGQLPELRSPDPQLQARVREAERSESIASHVSRISRMGAPSADAGGEAAAASRGSSMPQKLLPQGSRIYGILRRALYLADSFSRTPQEKWQLAKAFAEDHPEYCQIFSDGPLKTVFTSEYRLAALDLEDRRIAEGLRISWRAMLKMHELATARKIRFIVVLIPSKEAVFSEVWQDPPKDYRQLTVEEARVWSSTKSFLERQGIEYLDSLPALREQLARGLQNYPVSHDGHPNAHGHQAIAKLVAAHLQPSAPRE